MSTADFTSWPPSPREWGEMRDDIRELENLRQEVVKLAASYESLAQDYKEMKGDQEAFREGQVQRDLTLIKERGQNRRALYVLAGVLATAFFSTVGVLAAAGIFGHVGG